MHVRDSSHPTPRGVGLAAAVLTLIAIVMIGGPCATASADVLPAPYHGPSATTGTEFWFSFGANLGSGQNYVDISGTTATTATVAVPGLGFTTDVTVTPGEIAA